MSSSSSRTSSRAPALSRSRKPPTAPPLSLGEKHQARAPQSSLALPDLRFTHSGDPPRSDSPLTQIPRPQDSTLQAELLSVSTSSKNALLSRQLSNRNRFTRPTLYASLTPEELARSPRERWEAMMASTTTAVSPVDSLPPPLELQEPEDIPEQPAPSTPSRHRTRRSISSPLIPQAGFDSPAPVQVVRRVNSIAAPAKEGPKLAERGYATQGTPRSNERSNGAGAQMDIEEEIAGLLSVNGSAEQALHKVVESKRAIAARSDQLWQLVEGQRAMILDLNKNLERALREKDRYRQKLKETLNANNTVLERTKSDVERTGSIDVDQPATNLHRQQRDDIFIQSSPQTPPRQPWVPSSARALSNSLVDTPPTTHQRGDSIMSDTGSITVMEATPVKISPMSRAIATDSTRAQTPQTAPPPRLKMAIPSSPPSVHQRKAPPTPLNLASVTEQRQENVPHSKLESDSGCEQSPTTPSERGRRRTRDGNVSEEVQLTRSSKSSQKRKKPTMLPAESGASSVQRALDYENRTNIPFNAGLPLSPRQQIVDLKPFNPRSDGASQNLTAQSILAPLVSPGLPMSPRPADRPMNAPPPRPARIPLYTPHTENFSPLAGIPLSPREPKQFLPLASIGPMDIPSFDAPKDESTLLDSSSTTINDRTMSMQTGDVPVVAPEDASNDGVLEVLPVLPLSTQALPAIELKVTCSAFSTPHRHSPMQDGRDSYEDFIIHIVRRSDQRKLWSVQKTMSGLPTLHQSIKSVARFSGMLPQDTPLANEVRVNANLRQTALMRYFTIMVDTKFDEEAALIVCRYLSTNVVGSSGSSSPNTSVSDHDSAVAMGSNSPFGNSKRKTGYLTKKGKSFGGWNSRYFVLDGPELKYYAEAAEDKFMGSIQLKNARIARQNNERTPDSSDYKHAFLILEAKTQGLSSVVKHVLCAANDDSRDSWIEALLPYTMPPQTDVKDASGMPPNMYNPETRVISDPGLSIDNVDALRTVGYESTVAAQPPVMSAQPMPNPFASSLSIDSPSSSTSALAVPSSTNREPLFEEVAPAPAKSTKRGHSKKRSIFGFRTNKSNDDDTSSNSTSSRHGRSLSRHLPSAGKSSSRIVFGAPLAEAAKHFPPRDVDVLLPSPVYRCIEYLEYKSASEEEGIFRLSGASLVIKSLKERFNQEGDVKLVDGKHYDVHAIASVLKAYLRDLPESVLTSSLHVDLINAMDIAFPPSRLHAITTLIRSLPEANHELVATLTRFLIGVVNNSDRNKMTIRNISIVFAPTLNVPTEFIVLLLTEYPALFNDPNHPAAVQMQQGLGASEPTSAVSAGSVGGSANASRPGTPRVGDVRQLSNNALQQQQAAAMAYQQRYGAGAAPASSASSSPIVISELDGDSVFPPAAVVRPTTPFRDGYGAIESLRGRRPSGKI